MLAMDSSQYLASLIALEKSSTKADQSCPWLSHMVYVILIEKLFYRFNNFQKFLSRFWFFLQSQVLRTEGNSMLWEEEYENLDSPESESSSSQYPRFSFDNSKLEESNINRGDVEMAMANLGLFCSNESEELKEWMSSDELSQLFDEKEPSLEEVKEAFHVFDHNRDGFIDANELQRVFYSLGLKEGLEIENCRKMIKTFDENGDGRIDFNEFVKFMENSIC